MTPAQHEMEHWLQVAAALCDQETFDWTDFENIRCVASACMTLEADVTALRTKLATVTAECNKLVAQAELVVEGWREAHDRAVAERCQMAVERNATIAERDAARAALTEALDEFTAFIERDRRGDVYEPDRNWAASKVSDLRALVKP